MGIDEMMGDVSIWAILEWTTAMKEAMRAYKNCVGLVPRKVR